jgi:hypothetical protein
LFGKGIRAVDSNLLIRLPTREEMDRVDKAKAILKSVALEPHPFDQVKCAFIDFADRTSTPAQMRMG